MKHLMIVGLMVTGIVTTAHAGQTCAQREMTVGTLEKSLRLAARTMEFLDRTGHQVVVLARAGQDLSRYSVRYSHLGFAYRHPDGMGGSVWRVLHKLNRCGTSQSSVYRQGLGEFFMDDLWRYEAVYAVLNPEIQERLIEILRNDAQALTMHHSAYSMVSYAWGIRYQQSNQWAIETLASAADPNVATRSAAQHWLKQAGYRPAVLRIGPLIRLGGRIAHANIEFDDHPPEKRYADRIETVTVDSVLDWLRQAGLASIPVLVQP